MDLTVITTIAKGLGILALIGAGIFIYWQGRLAEENKNKGEMLDVLEKQRNDAAKPAPSTNTVRKRLRDGDF